MCVWWCVSGGGVAVESCLRACLLAWSVRTAVAACCVLRSLLPCPSCSPDPRCPVGGTGAPCARTSHGQRRRRTVNCSRTKHRQARRNTQRSTYITEIYNDARKWHHQHMRIASNSLATSSAAVSRLLTCRARLRPPACVCCTLCCSCCVVAACALFGRPCCWSCTTVPLPASRALPLQAWQRELA